MAPLDIEPDDIEPLCEPDDIEPLCVPVDIEPEDMEPLPVDCAQAAPVTAALRTKTRPAIFA